MISTARFASVLLTFLTAASSVSAALFTWDGKASGGNLNDWNKQQNWAGNVVPGTTDEALFSTVTAGRSVSPTMAAATGIGLIRFSAGGLAFTVGGVGPLTLNAIAGVGIQNDNITATETFTTSAILLGANQAWNNSGTLNFTGSSVNLSTRSLTINNAGTLGMTGGTINAANSSLAVAGAGTTTIADNILGANGTLTKSGAGTLTLSGANAYSGLTTVSAGALGFTGAGQLGSGGVTISGGTLSASTDAQLGTGSAAVTLGNGALSTSGTFTSAKY